MNINSALDIFLRDQIIKNNSKKTIKAYSQFCGYFVDYVGKFYNLDDLTLEDIENYYLYLKTKPKNLGHKNKKVVSNETTSSITIQTYMRHLKIFINYLYNNNYIEDNIMKNYHLPKASKKLIEILSNEEIIIINDYILNNCTTTKYRNLSMFFLMVDCGLRASEVVNLKLKNIYFDRNIIKVLGKGNKERFVPISDINISIIQKYIEIERPSSDDNNLFLTESGFQMTYDVLRKIIQRIATKTGIKRLHCHLLRHTYATMYLINGGDIASLKVILGHTNYNICEIYLHLANQYTINKFVKFSPLENINLRPTDF